MVVTKHLPGDRWLDVLTKSGCRVEVCTSPDTILNNATIKKLIGTKCDGVIGQLTEVSATTNTSDSILARVILAWNAIWNRLERGSPT